MATVQQIDGDVIVRGALTITGETSMRTASVDNDAVTSDADIDASKLEHQHRQVYAQESDTTSVTETRVVHVVDGAAGTINAFKAGSVTVCSGAATIVVDLLKNGVSVLSAGITLDTGNSIRVVEAGTISSASVAAGDVLEVDVTATAGGGTLGKGVFAYVDLYEDA